MSKANGKVAIVTGSSLVSAPQSRSGSQQTASPSLSTALAAPRLFAHSIVRHGANKQARAIAACACEARNPLCDQMARMQQPRQLGAAAS